MSVIDDGSTTSFALVISVCPWRLSMSPFFAGPFCPISDRNLRRSTYNRRRRYRRRLRATRPDRPPPPPPSGTGWSCAVLPATTSGTSRRSRRRPWACWSRATWWRPRTGWPTARACGSGCATSPRLPTAACRARRPGRWPPTRRTSSTWSRTPTPRTVSGFYRNVQ